MRRGEGPALRVEVALTALPALPVVVVTAPACHFCEEATEHLSTVAARHALDVREVEIATPEGARLVAEHRPALNPLVLVDGQFFSAGRLPRRKLDALLRDREARAAHAGADDARAVVGHGR